MPATVVINTNSSGNTVLIADGSVPAGFCVRVINWHYVVGGAVTVQFQDTDGTALSGPQTWANAGQGANGPDIELNAREQFRTKKGHGLQINLSGSVQVGGYVVYEWAPQ